MCDKEFLKLNMRRAKCHLLKINGVGVAVCQKNTHEQRRQRPGGSVVTTRSHVDTLFKPTLSTDVDKAISNLVYVPFNVHSLP